MFKIFFKDHKEILKTVKVIYKLIFAYLSIVIFLGLTESFGIALLFPISELIQNQEIVNQYTKVFYEYSGYNISSENLISIIFISAFFLIGLVFSAKKKYRVLKKDHDLITKEVQNLRRMPIQD